MYNTRKIITILSVLALLGSFLMVAFAKSSSDITISEPIDLIVNQTTDPYAYATSPDGLYVFRYYGTAPYLSMDIDTSMCSIGRLYVYDALTDTVLQVSTQEVSVYTCTQDALFYVTTDQKIYKTDYTGTVHEFLYQGVNGNIHCLNSYLNTLYFIENQENVVFLDVQTKTAQAVWSYDNLDWVFLPNMTQIVATTIDEDDLIYDIASETVAEISALEANQIVTDTVQETDSATDSDISIMSYFSSSSVTQENDISFPLSEYPATLYDNTAVNNSDHYRPISWFHVNGSEGCSSSNCKTYSGTSECEGFARYAHDAYVHMVDNSVAYSAWDDNKHPAGMTRFDSNITTIQSFFANMKTGAYIRYGKDSDSTPANGVHSIVFVSMDSGGIWVYECNQSYYDNLTSDQIGGHSESYFGCGVHFQYYTFQKLTKYHYVLHYVNHDFNEPLTSYDEDYHKKGCTSCDGYVLQSHTNVSTDYLDAYEHMATFNCCGGFVVEATAHDDITSTIVDKSGHETTYHCCGERSTLLYHTGDVVYTEISSSKHSVKYTCCSGYVTEAHCFDYNEYEQIECIFCGYISNNLLDIEEEEIN